MIEHTEYIPGCIQFEKCSNCNQESISKKLCISCNNEKGFYLLKLNYDLISNNRYVD